MRKMHRWGFRVLFTVLLLISMVWAAFAEDKQPAEDRAALVNGSVITKAAFNREMNQVQRRLMAGGQRLTESELPQLQARVLDGMINRELLYQESLKKGIKVEEKEVNEKLESIKKQYPGEEEFKSILSQNGLDEATLKTEIAKGTGIKKFIDQEFKERSKVSDKDAKAFYESNPKQFTRPEEVRASHILVKVEKTATEEQKVEARKKIEGIQDRLAKGEDFGALAKEVSDCPSSKQNGDLNYFRRGQGMVKPFEDAAFSMKKDEVSAIVETEFGYHLIKVTDKKPETKEEYDTIKDRLIGFMEQRKMQEEIQRYVSKVKEESKIEKFLEKRESQN